MNFLRKLTKNNFKNLYKYEINTTFRRNVRAFIRKGVEEPLYLDYLKPQIPYYPLLNIQVCGYDFPVLESYAKYLHNLSNKLGLSVVKVWCSPLTTTKYDILKLESEITESTFSMNLYERNLQIENLSAKMAPILLEILVNSVPLGVSFSVHPHDFDHEESRYIPDLQLAAFKSELEELKGNRTEIEEEEPKKTKK